jgi:hypothetical protein
MIPMAVRILSGISPPEERMSQQFQFVRMVAQALDLEYVSSATIVFLPRSLTFPSCSHAIQAGVPPTEPGAVAHWITPFSPELISDLNMPFDCYPAFCQLLQLKEDVYRELYSISAQDKPDYEVIAAVGRLDSQLEQWRDDIPEAYRPGHSKSKETVCHGVADTVLHLHLSYYNSVLVIHRRSMCYGMLPNASSSASTTRAHTAWSSNTRALISTQLCADAARATLRLVKYIPKHNPLTRG